jgi:hypothetical protein
VTRYAIGDRVRVVADNYGIDGVIVDIRAGDYPYLVATDDGQQTWYAAWEVFDV